MTFYRKLAGVLCTLGAIGGGIAMFLMMVQVGADVTMKYLLNKPIMYTLEMVSSYYMVALVFLPLGLVTKANAHVVVELFTQGLSKRNLALIDAFAACLSLIYTSLITRQAFRVALEKTEVRESWEAATLDIQVWPARWFLVVGCAIMTLYLVVLIIDNLTLFLKGDDDEGDDPAVPSETAQPSSSDAKHSVRLELQTAPRKIQNSLKDPTTWSL